MDNSCTFLIIMRGTNPSRPQSRVTFNTEPVATDAEKRVSSSRLYEGY